MSLTLTPLPGNVSAKSLLPNTDPATGIVTATGRPTRHAWAVGQTVLEGMGIRLDLMGAGRRHGEDLELLTAWLTAYEVRALVLRHATNIGNLDVLDDLLHVATTTRTHLAITCDETVGERLVDWVTERSGSIDSDATALLDRLGSLRREPTAGAPVAAQDDFPRLMPRVDFYKFRARCRDVLTPEQFALVDTRYTATFKQVQADPFATATEASSRLTHAINETGNPGIAITVLRAAQAAMFTHGLLLKVNVDYFLNGARDHDHRRLTPDELTALRGYRTPWRSCAVVLRDANLSRDQIVALRLCDVTDDGNLNATDHDPLSSQARLYLRAQRVLRLIHGATDTEPFITESARYIAQAQRRASIDLNLPITPAREPANASRRDRWTASLGVALLPLTTQHLPAPDTIKNGTR